MGGFIEDEWATEEERKATREGSGKQTSVGQKVAPEKMGCWSTLESLHKGSPLSSGLETYYNLSE